MEPMSSIERLDLAARAQCNAALISRLRFFLPFFALLVIFLAVGSTAPALETFLVRIMAVAAVITTVILWLDWRYEFYALAALCFIFGVGYCVINDHPMSHTVMRWIGAHSYALLFFYWGFGLLTIAGRYAMVNGKDWQKERDQLDAWLSILKNRDAAEVRAKRGHDKNCARRAGRSATPGSKDDTINVHAFP